MKVIVRRGNDERACSCRIDRERWNREALPTPS